MKMIKKISAVISKAAEIICMLMIAGLVVVIVGELINRNIFNGSNRATIEICGIQFLWMAFIGIIPLYHESGLMRLDFLVSRVHGAAGEVLYFINKLFSFGLGVVMVVAFIAQYPYVSTRFYSTFSFPLAYTIQYIPMGIAGIYMALETVIQVLDRVLQLAAGRHEKQTGRNMA